MATSDAPPKVDPSSKFALVDEFPPISFKSVAQLKTVIARKFEKLKDHGDQHVAVGGISQGLFNRIESGRLGHGSSIRLTYFGDIETMIVKLVSEPHERAHRTLGRQIEHRMFHPMQLSFSEFLDIGSSKYTGQNQSAKEGDTAWKNILLRPKQGDWPCVVIEAGLSESLPRLRVDASWWIQNSGGQVKMVLLIWIQPSLKKVAIEKWIPTMPMTRTSPRRPAQTYPICNAKISIDQSQTPSTFQGPQLTLEFENLVGRPANPPLEGDVIFTHPDLDQWASSLWFQ
ncbi:hypothetical protein V8E54_007745 [Elaphomyces granulatus]